MSKIIKANASGHAATPEVSAHATQSKALPLNKPVLLGTFGNADAPGALLRLRSGNVVKVSPGENLRIGKVVGIAEGEVIIARRGRTTRLTMPN